MRTSQLLLRACSVSWFALLLLAGVFFPPQASAQIVTEAVQTGFPVFSSFHGTEFDSVLLQNGNLHINIPVVSVPQRKGALTFSFAYDTPTWTRRDTLNAGNSISVVTPTADPATFWRVTDHSTFWYLIYTPDSVTCGPSGPNQIHHGMYHNFALVDPEGTKHPLGIRWETDGTPSFCYGSLPKGYTLDGSGILVDISAWPLSGPFPGATKVVLKDGTTLNGTFAISAREDSNGNQISASYLAYGTIPTSQVLTTSDELGRTLVSQSLGPSTTYTTPLGQTAPGYAYVLYTVNDSGGNPQNFRLDYQAIDIHTAGCIPPAFSNCTEDSEAWIVPKKLTLPDGLFYQFTWQNNGFGDLLGITLPTGGSISYTYGTQEMLSGQSFSYSSSLGGGQPFCCGPGSIGSSNSQQTFYAIRRAVGSRTVTNTDGTTAPWTYDNGTFHVSTVTDPTGAKEVHSFSNMTCGNNCLSSTPYETLLQVYDPAGNLLRTVQKDYAFEQGSIAAGPTSSEPIVNIRVVRETTTLENGLVTKKETDYETFPSPDGLFTAILLNPTEIREFDYGNGSPGALLRRTDFTYLHQASTGGAGVPNAYLSLNIADRPASQKTYDGAGNLVAQTTFTYDDFALASTSGTPAPGHDYTNFSSAFTTRGNLTQTNHWLNPGNTFLTTKNHYDDLGNLVSTTDPLNNTTSFSYTDNFADGVNRNAQAYVTQITHPITSGVNHVEKKQYFWNTGLPAASCGQNFTGACLNSVNPTTASPVPDFTKYFYDAMNRPVTVTRGDGGQTSFCYSDTAGASCSNGGSPLQVVTTKAITSSQSWIATTVIDGLGRTRQTQLTSDPQGVDYTTTTFDALGRVSSVYNPTRCNPPTTNCGESTWGYTTTQYDTLGRVILTIPPDGTATTNNVGTSYSGNSVTVTDQAGKQRRSVSDGLGRLIEVDEPGDAYPGVQSSGSLTISGSLQSVSGIGAHGATSGTGPVTISGTEQVQVGVTTCTGTFPNLHCTTTNRYDFGNVSITVNGFTKSGSFGQGSSPSTIAAALVSAFNNDGASPVTASCSDGPCTTPTITLTARAQGAATNYSYSTSWSFDSAHFSSSSFTASPTSSAMTNGQDAFGGNTVYDSGTLTASVAGFTTAAVSYGQSSNSTAAQVASALGTALGTSGSPVTVNSVSGATISLTYKTAGTAGNVTITVTPTSSNPSQFPSGSFASSGSLSGGTDPYPSGLAHAYTTLYQYDALGNLLCVHQRGADTTSDKSCTDATVPAAWRPRSFTYNSLSQLLTATNPESGTISYTYDNNGNLLTKIAPAPNQTGSATVTSTYSYDALNRLTQKSFSDGITPTAQYGYDAVAPVGCTPPTLAVNNGIGRRTSMCDAAGSEAWSYDPMGRPFVDQRYLAPIGRGGAPFTGTTTYVYNLDGSIKTLTYPSGRIFTYAYNSAAQPVSAADNFNVSYASGAVYAPTGALASLTNGSGLVTTQFYNQRLQPCRISVTTAATLPTNCGDSANIGNVLDFNYNFSVGVADNGNVTGITNNRDSARSQSFTYDPLNRIATAQTQATSGTKCWGESFSYDPWGNLKSITGIQPQYTGCTQESGFSFTMAANNRVSGYCYDAAGNLLDQGPCPGGTNPHAYTYNAENQLVFTAGFTYTYDGDGKRVSKDSPKMYLYGMGSDPLDETDGSLFTEYVFFGGKRIARRDPSNNISYYFADHLGTARVVTNSSGAILDDSDFYPFGGERPILSSSGNTYKFTGKERDPESGLDDFEARYYSSALGRFTIPDWAESATAVPYADFGDPQSLNLYSYVRNNSLNAIDPDGHDPDPDPDRRGRRPAGTCGFWCRLSFIFRGGSGKTVPSPGNPNIVFVYNAVAGFFNFSQRLGHALGAKSPLHEMPRMDNKGGVEAIDLALLFIPGFDEAVAAERVTSLIGSDPELIRLAEQAGRSDQAGIDRLFEELMKGNRNPGIGTKSLGRGIWYARSRDGARLFFRVSNREIQILGKATKHNEAQVIRRILQLF